MCLNLSKNLKTLSLSELYGNMLNHEQSGKLKKNLIWDVKDSKSTSVALYIEYVPLASSSTLTATKLDLSNSKDLSENNLSEFDESLTLSHKLFQKIF